jgi:hypothetical protein
MGLYDVPTPDEIDTWPLVDIDVEQQDPSGVIGFLACVNCAEADDNDLNPYDEESDYFDPALYWVGDDVRNAMRNLRHRLSLGEEIDTELLGIRVVISPKVE